MLENKDLIQLYMFHGGTSFGFMNGANTSRNDPYQPDTSSYDYDSPLDEAGRPTPKYYALRDVIKKHLSAGETLPDVPASRDLIEIPAFDLKETEGNARYWAKPVRSEKPLVDGDDVGQDYGYVLYRKKLGKAFSGELKFDSLRDYGLIYVDGKAAGTVDRRLKQNAVTINAKEGSTLDVLGRKQRPFGIYTPGREFNLDRKGIIGDVMARRRGPEKDWETFYGLPLNDLKSLKAKNSAAENDLPKFYRGSFNLDGDRRPHFLILQPGARASFG